MCYSHILTYFVGPLVHSYRGGKDRYEMDRLESSRLHNEVMMRFDQLRGSSKGVRWKLQMRLVLITQVEDLNSALVNAI